MNTERPAESPANAAREFDTRWNYADPAATEAAFRELLPAATAAGDPAHLAELLSQIARTHSLRRSFDEAHRLLDEASKVLDDAGEAPRAPSVARARILLERGRSWNSAGDKERAVDAFRRALETARAAGSDFHAIDAMHMLGIAAPPDEALRWNEEAIAAAEASPSARAKGWLGALCNNTGWSWFERGAYDKALACFERDVAWRRARGADDTVSRWSAAKARRRLGRLDEALAEQRALLAHHEAKGTSDGFVLEELGECLWALDRHDEARPWLARAYTALVEIDWMRSDEHPRLASLHARGGVTTPLAAAPSRPEAPDGA